MDLKSIDWDSAGWIHLAQVWTIVGLGEQCNKP